MITVAKHSLAFLILLITLMAAGCGPGVESSPQATVAEGRVGFWKFEENFNDSSGAGNPGLPIGNPDFDQGKVGNALRLNGTNQCVNIPSLAEAVTQFTLAAWIYVEGMPPEDDMASVYHNDGWEIADVHLPYSSGDGTMDLGIKGNQPDMSIPSFKIGDQLNRWLHLVTTYNANAEPEVRFYLDGELTDTFPLEKAIPVNLGPGSIGSWNADVRWFNGLIDEVHVFTRVLDPVEVQSLFKAGSL